MRLFRRLAVALLAGGVLAVAPSSAAASTAPQSCNGHVIALINQISGAGGASGNAEAAAGPGYFFGPETSDAITTVRNEFLCS
jgi:hypothetical protein